MSEQLKKSGRGRSIAVIATVLLVVVLGLLVWGIASLLNGKSSNHPKAPKITLLASPPPPPPPPKIEKKPDPPKVQKEIKIEQPKPAPPQPSNELKMEGPAGNGPSSFSAGKITSDDVSKLGSTGGVKGGMFDPVASYDNLTSGELKRYFRKNKLLSQRFFTVDINIWFGDEGELKKFKLLGSSGDSEIDDALKEALSALPGFSQKPPANMPQPSRLRISFLH